MEDSVRTALTLNLNKKGLEYLEKIGVMLVVWGFMWICRVL